MLMKIPNDAAFILTRLRQAGHRAYVVGGCVRDALLGVVPKDWDVCTSATPDQMQQIFAGEHVVETGLKHGTLTVVLHHVPYEVTTFRVDGAYTDHRHPDGVTFVTDVREDLARRDFTVNAMAYDPTEGLVDAFGGQEDLSQKCIRCVGEPERRFGEDALRILRALRFAAVYDFTIEPDTARAIHSLYPTLSDVAAERIHVELAKLLCGVGASRILREYPDVISFLLPELAASVGFDQHTHHHRYDVWEHTLRVLESVPPTETMRLAALLHDCGKPETFFWGEDGEGHMNGHPQRSFELAAPALLRLRIDNATRDRVLLLIQRHDIDLTQEKRLLTRRLSQFGEETLRQLFALRSADYIGTGMTSPADADAWLVRANTLLDEIIASRPCVSVKDLAVNGGDLMAAGIPRGPKLGACLAELLDAVLSQRVENEKQALTDYAAAWLHTLDNQ